MLGEQIRFCSLIRLVYLKHVPSNASTVAINTPDLTDLEEPPLEILHVVVDLLPLWEIKGPSKRLRQANPGQLTLDLFAAGKCSAHPTRLQRTDQGILVSVRGLMYATRNGLSGQPKV